MGFGRRVRCLRPQSRPRSRRVPMACMVVAPNRGWVVVDVSGGTETGWFAPG